LAVFNYESIIVGGTAIGITTANRDQKHNYAFITVETAAVRWRCDGTDPTAAEGHILEVGDTLELEGMDELTKFKAIRKDGVDAALKSSTGVR